MDSIVCTDADFLSSRRKSVFQLAVFHWVNKQIKQGQDAFMLSVYLSISPNTVFKQSQLGGG